MAVQSCMNIKTCKLLLDDLRTYQLLEDFSAINSSLLRASPQKSQKVHVVFAYNYGENVDARKSANHLKAIVTTGKNYYCNLSWFRQISAPTERFDRWKLDTLQQVRSTTVLQDPFPPRWLLEREENPQKLTGGTWKSSHLKREISNLVSSSSSPDPCWISGK